MSKIWGIALSALFVVAIIALVFRWGKARQVVTGQAAA